MPAGVGFFAKGILLGLGAAVPIGPVNVQLARRALRHGFFAGFALGCGAVTVDVFYAVLTSTGIERVAQSKPLAWTLRIAGIALLSYLGAMCLRGEREAWRADAVTTGDGAATNPDAGPGGRSAVLPGPAFGPHATVAHVDTPSVVHSAVHWVRQRAVLSAAARARAAERYRESVELCLTQVGRAL